MNRRPRTSPIQDARGRRITLLDPYELALLRRYAVIPAEALRLIADEVGFGLPKWQRRGYFACVSAFLACIVFLVFWKLMRRTGIDTMERVLWPLNLAVFAIGAVQFWRSGRRARAERVRVIMLKHLRCPHCGYDIRGLPTDAEDDATICPECGCSWQLTRDTTPENAPQANEP